MGNAGQKNYVEQMRIFEKETELYQYLIPRLQDIAIGAKEWAAQSYLSKDDKVLILEDLRLDGFRVPLCSNGIFDLEHLKVVMQVLGRFHASSMILENRTRESIIQLYPEVLNETAYPDDEKSVRMLGLNNAIAALWSLIKEIPKYKTDPRALEVIESRFPETVKKIIEFAKTSSKYRNVLCHGDLWANNFLFAYEAVEDYDSSDNESNTEKVDVEINNNNCDAEDIESVLKDLDDQIQAAKSIIRSSGTLKPVDCRLVDFQLARYAPPGLDVMTVLFMTTRTEFREKHQKEVLQHYYEALSVELDRVGMDVSYELPEDQFWETTEHYSFAGMIETCLFSHLILLPEEHTEKMFSNSDEFGQFITSAEKRSEVVLKEFHADRKYRERMTEMLCELIDSNILEVTAL